MVILLKNTHLDAGWPLFQLKEISAVISLMNRILHVIIMGVKHTHLGQEKVNDINAFQSSFFNTKVFGLLFKNSPSKCVQKQKMPR